jgi:hypothetical protein
MRCGIFLLALFGLCVCLGCGSETGLEGLVEVSGLITYDGKPVEAATVAFVPEGEGRAASGMTDADGKFQLTTLKPGDGARPGRYKVTVSKVENLGPESQITAQEMSDMITKGKMPPPMGPTASPGFIWQWHEAPCAGEIWQPGNVGIGSRSRRIRIQRL